MYLSTPSRFTFVRELSTITTINRCDKGKKMDKVIVSEGSFNSTDPYDIIDSNISFINVLREEGFEGELCPEAQTSYYVDYYSSQVKNGGFSQFVYNSGWNDELNAIIREGLEKMHAVEHLAFFNKQAIFVDNFDEFELAKFLDSDYFGKNPTREALNNDDFFDIKENLIDLNASWLKTLTNLSVLSVDNMFQEAEKILGKAISRD